MLLNGPKGDEKMNEKNYKENPKTKDSGIICCIPQIGKCPNKCEDCFFQSGRSYLEPLKDNLPNMPTIEQVGHRIVRVNDGNDSNVDRQLVMDMTSEYKHKFYNTAIPKNLDKFDAPVVLTVNPGEMTDSEFHKIHPIPNNLMFVRIRTNMWNLKLVDNAVQYYSREIPIVLTFMAYFKKLISEEFERFYTFRKRTSNSYWAITTHAWEIVMDKYKYNKWVYSCGMIEGEKGITACRHCGNCIREYFATMEHLNS